MTWLAIIQLILSALGSLTKLLGDRQLLEAGAAQATLEGLRQADEAIKKARAAGEAVRRDIADNPDKLRDDDGHRRD